MENKMSSWFAISVSLLVLIPVSTGGTLAARIGFELKDKPADTALAPTIAVHGATQAELNTGYTYSASASSCNPSQTWKWTAAGGLIQGDATGNHIVVRWRTAGGYEVTARNDGCPGVLGVTHVVVSNADTRQEPLRAQFTISPTIPRLGEPVTFDSNSSTGNPVNIKWAFGDGTSATGTITSHSYSQAGAFNVTLSVSRPGEEDSTTQMVHMTMSAPQANTSVVQVFYATDRAVSSHNPLGYGPSRAASLSFGRFDVSVPKDHRLAHIERPSILRFEFQEDPNKHFVIVARKAETEAEFYREAAGVVSASQAKEAFVFVHGFNVPFEDAVYRTAQLAYDLEFSGAAFLYSWPSNAEVVDYIGDLNNNDWTVPHLKSFLESVASRTGARRVHLIAHSMGNRALSNALSQIANAPAGPVRPHFCQLVLTAPDIDKDTFKSLARAITKTADHTTLYASANDKALTLSKTLNRYPRAGDATGTVTIVSGVDTIDASALDTDFIGHSYYGDHRSVVADIFSLLSEAKPPGQRFGLKAIRIASGTYWRFLP